MADSLETTVGRLEAPQQQNRRFVADVVARAADAAHRARRRGVADRERPRRACRPTRRRAAELLVADVRRLRVLVDDLMEISRFDADAEQPSLEPVDLGRVVTAVVAVAPPGGRDRPARAAGRRGRPTPAASTGSSATSSTTPATTRPTAPVEVSLTRDARRARWSSSRTAARASRADALPHAVRPLLQGRPVARRGGSSRPGPRDRRRARGAARRQPAGAAPAGRRPDLRAHAAGDPIVTRGRCAGHGRRRTLARHRNPHRGPVRDPPAQAVRSSLALVRRRPRRRLLADDPARSARRPRRRRRTCRRSRSPSDDATPDLSSPSPEPPRPPPAHRRRRRPRPSPAAPTAAPTAPPPTKAPTGTTIVRAYFFLGSFTGNAGLAPVLREIPKTQAVATAAMSALLAGPNATELGRQPGDVHRRSRRARGCSA